MCVMYDGSRIALSLIEPPSAPERGVGKVMISYALERAMDRLARVLSIDPIDSE